MRNDIRNTGRYEENFCTVREDLIEQELAVPIGDEFYCDTAPLLYRWRNNDADFEVFYNGKWQEAYSIDFEFN